MLKCPVAGIETLQPSELSAQPKGSLRIFCDHLVLIQARLTCPVGAKTSGRRVERIKAVHVPAHNTPS